METWVLLKASESFCEISPDDNLQHTVFKQIKLKIKYFLETEQCSALDTVCYLNHTTTFHINVCDSLGFSGTAVMEVVCMCRTNIFISMDVTATL